jgi:hypothetical protein
MAHWAEIDENNIVIRVTVGSNEDPDEGYQWLIDNLGGRWIKTSYNSFGGVHYKSELDEKGKRIPSGNPHLRFNFAGTGFTYDENLDAFIPPKPEEDENTKFWLNPQTCLWEEV